MTKQGYTHIIVPQILHNQLKTLAQQNNISINLSLNIGINTVQQTTLKQSLSKVLNQQISQKLNCFQ